MNTTPVYALAGVAVDLARLATFRFDNPHSLTKFWNLNRARKRTGARVCIEAGTFLGITAARCARVFEHVYTVEIDPALVQKATQRLHRYQNVDVIEGDAADVTSALLARPEVQDVLIFWDGHLAGVYDHSSRGAHEAYGVEPVMAGLERCIPYLDKVRAIVVDDFRLFGTEAGFPSKSDLLAFAERLGEGAFSIRIHLDQLLLERHQR